MRNLLSLMILMNKQLLSTKNSGKMDTTMYHVVVNVTLDCNLRCWYCYEKKIHNSKLYANVIEAIKLNVTLQYEKVRFKTLKISFFGGEPFLNFEGIRKILDFARTFCKTKDVVLLADFTTNATLIRKEHLEYLQDLKCFFKSHWMEIVKNIMKSST